MLRPASLLALSLVTLNTGCFLFDAGEKTEFVEADDIRLDLPQSIAARDGGTQVRGDLHRAVEYTADQTNTWVTRIVENAATVVRFLDDVRPTEHDGTTRIYGPYDDDDGRDLSWLVRLDTLEDGSRYEVFVGVRGAKSQADMDKLMTGELHHDERDRSGGFVMDFDVVEKHSEMKGPDADLSVIGGVVEVTFTRNVDTEEKTIDLDFKAVSFEYLGYLDDDSFYSDDRYGYTHHGDGSGSFVLAAYGEWDDHGWSGPEKERMLAQAVWNADGAGRTHGEVLEVDGVGDMKHGDLFLDECFGADGFLTWRALNEPYALEAPGYGFGEEKSCALPTTALENL